MKFSTKIKTQYWREKLGFVKLNLASKKLVFDLGAIPIIAAMVLLFSTIGASIFYKKDIFEKEKNTNLIETPLLRAAGVEQIVNTYTTLDQTDPVIASFSDSSYIVVYIHIILVDTML